MLKIEKKIINHIERYIIIYFLVFISIVSFIIRYLGRSFISVDMQRFLLPWWAAIPDFNSLSKPVGDYNLIYQSIIAFLHYLPFNPVSAYKVVSCIFDYILAIGCGLLVIEFKNKNRLFIFSLVYASVLFLPTVFLNSAFWGQADSIYSSFVILSLLFLIRGRYNIAFICLGFGFAFKLQTVFILPVFCFYYFINKKFSLIKMFLITISSMYALCIPGFLFGRSLLEPLEIYLYQTTYENLYRDFPSFWALIAPANSYTYSLFKTVGILTTIAILASGLVYIYYKKLDISKINLIYLSIWICYTCVIFLPGMHERYAYVIDLLLLSACFCNKNLKFFALISILSSLSRYSMYLFTLDFETPFTIFALVYIINYLSFSYMYFNNKFNINNLN